MKTMLLSLITVVLVGCGAPQQAQDKGAGPIGPSAQEALYSSALYTWQGAQRVTPPSGMQTGVWSVVVDYDAEASQVWYARLFDYGGYHGPDGGMDIDLGVGTISCLLWDSGHPPGDAAVRLDGVNPDAGRHRVGCSYDGTTLTMYVDGVLQGSVAGAYRTTTGDLGIGKSSNDPSFDFNGIIHGAYWYDRALSGAELQTATE